MNILLATWLLKSPGTTSVWAKVSKSELTSFINVTTQASFLSLCNGLSVVQVWGRRVERIKVENVWSLPPWWLLSHWGVGGSLAERERGRLALQRSIQLPQPWRELEDFRLTRFMGIFYVPAVCQALLSCHQCDSINKWNPAMSFTAWSGGRQINIWLQFRVSSSVEERSPF